MFLELQRNINNHPHFVPTVVSKAGRCSSRCRLVETPEKVEKYQNTQGFVYPEAAKGLVVYER